MIKKRSFLLCPRFWLFAPPYPAAAVACLIPLLFFFGPPQASKYIYLYQAYKDPYYRNGAPTVTFCQNEDDIGFPDACNWPREKRKPWFGLVRDWYPDGQLECRQEYKNGTRYGKYEYFYPNGQLQTRGFWNGYNRVGTWEWWKDDGTPIASGTFKNGWKCQGIFPAYNYDLSYLEEGDTVYYIDGYKVTREEYRSFMESQNGGRPARETID